MSRRAEIAELSNAIKLIEARLIAARHLRLTDRIRLLESEKKRLEIRRAELQAAG
jgi:hypothetical protein